MQSLTSVQVQSVYNGAVRSNPFKINRCCARTLRAVTSERGVLWKWSAVKIKTRSTTCDTPPCLESRFSILFKCFKVSRRAWYWNIYYRPVIVVSHMAGGGWFSLSIVSDNSECCMYTFAVSLSSWQPIHSMALSYIQKIRGSTSDEDCDASTISQTSRQHIVSYFKYDCQLLA